MAEQYTSFITNEMEKIYSKIGSTVCVICKDVLLLQDA